MQRRLGERLSLLEQINVISKGHFASILILIWVLPCAEIEVPVVIIQAGILVGSPLLLDGWLEWGCLELCGLTLNLELLRLEVRSLVEAHNIGVPSNCLLVHDCILHIWWNLVRSLSGMRWLLDNFIFLNLNFSDLLHLSEALSYSWRSWRLFAWSEPVFTFKGLTILWIHRSVVFKFDGRPWNFLDMRFRRLVSISLNSQLLSEQLIVLNALNSKFDLWV